MFFNWRLFFRALRLSLFSQPFGIRRWAYVLFYTGLLICVFAVTIIVAAITEGGPTFGSRWQDTRWTKPLLVIACLTAFAFALEPLGFLLSAIPLMLLLLRVIDPVRWSLTIPTPLPTA